MPRGQVVDLLVALRENGFSATNVRVGEGENPSVELDGVVDLRAQSPRRRREDRGVDALLRQAGGDAYEEMKAMAEVGRSVAPSGAGDMATIPDGDD